MAAKGPISGKAKASGTIQSGWSLSHSSTKIAMPASA